MLVEDGTQLAQVWEGGDTFLRDWDYRPLLLFRAGHIDFQLMDPASRRTNLLTNEPEQENDIQNAERPLSARLWIQPPGTNVLELSKIMLLSSGIQQAHDFSAYNFSSKT